MKTGGNTQSAQVQYGGNRKRIVQVARRARENIAASRPEFALPDACSMIHRIRMSFLMLLLGDALGKWQLTRHSMLKRLEALEPDSREGKFALATLSECEVENFVREFDGGSRFLWSILVDYDDKPLLQLQIIIAARTYLVNGNRIRQFVIAVRSLKQVLTKALIMQKAWAGWRAQPSVSCIRLGSSSTAFLACA